LVPLASLTCGLIGALVACFANSELWKDIQNAIAFYAAGLAINAIILAVCWASFARIFDTLGEPEFGGWMRATGMEGYYQFYVDYIQLTQMIAVAAMAGGLITSLLVGVPDWLNRSLFGFAIASSLYAGRWATGCVRVMQELAGHRNTFAEKSGNIRGFKAGP
jgi:hypothetical protein